ncbi:DUF6355 family natural product biosynthesis protein [Amycolatopsis sp. cg5]|uniref:DUF6355 family natural product biosynthesis protein n=1 Tax=Amycolatopsis sp. cg5 TaxID=3238802 RepID=UPI0035236E56
MLKNKVARAVIPVAFAAAALVGGTASASAAPAPAGPAAVQDDPCGLHVHSGNGYYRNCGSRSVKILVTKVFTANERFCVGAGTEKFVGTWNNIWNSYVEGYDCDPNA